MIDRTQKGEWKDDWQEIKGEWKDDWQDIKDEWKDDWQDKKRWMKGRLTGHKNMIDKTKRKGNWKDDLKDE